ncbi:hypothetical protein BRD20_11840 [Halobacteriales archaeon SW_8_65_20]|nr:MAG: hypothetical protein BRD20_11840 [Halobacteriales archaeon SW_8_65_20]
MTVAESYASKEDIEYTKEMDDKSRTDKFVTDNYNFKTRFFKSLHKEERESSEDCIYYYGPDLCFANPSPAEDLEHDPYVWSNASITDVSEYENDNPSRYDESWEPINYDGTGSSGEKIAGEGQLGFAGKCTSNELWTERSGNADRCQFENRVPGSDATLNVEFFSLNFDVDDDQVGNYAGFKIPETTTRTVVPDCARSGGSSPTCPGTVQKTVNQVQRFNAAYRKPEIDGSNTNYGPMRVEAQCYLGTGENVAPQDKMLNMTAEYNVDGPTYMIGQIPDRPDADVNRDAYTCAYGFVQKHPNSEHTITEGVDNNNRLTTNTDFIVPSGSRQDSQQSQLNDWSQTGQSTHALRTSTEPNGNAQWETELFDDFVSESEQA